MSLIFWQISRLSLIVGSQRILGKQNAVDRQVCLKFVEQSSSGWSGRGIEAQVVELEEIDCAPSWQGWNQQGFHLISWGDCTKLLFLPLLFFFVLLNPKTLPCLFCSFLCSWIIHNSLFLPSPPFQDSYLDLCSIRLRCSNNNPSFCLTCIFKTA